MDANHSEDDMYASNMSADDNFFDTTSDDTNSPNIISTPLLSPEEMAKQREQWESDLAKLEDDILTLRQVLSAKVRQASELKRKLGITPYVELKSDLKQGLQNIKDTDAYQKTNESIKTLATKVAENEKYQKTKDALSTVGQKTTSTISSVGSFTSNRWTAMRNSASFKSFEHGVGTAYSNVKSKVRSSQSEQNFEDILNANNVSAQEMSVKSVPNTPAEESAPDI